MIVTAGPLGVRPLWFSVWQDRRVRNRAQAIITEIAAVEFPANAVLSTSPKQRT